MDTSACCSGGKTTKSGRKIIKFYAGDPCRYDVVRSCAAAKGWKLVSDPAQRKNCNIFWVDTSPVGEHMNGIKPWQRINHFPGMINISRKDRLAKNLDAMKKEFPEDYSFFPKTYVLPSDMKIFRENFGGTNKKTFIVKPDSGAQGRGIFLTRTIDSIDPEAALVAQEYVERPLLIDGKKFDLRIYVLMTSCKPLRLYLFRDGLVRICTEMFARPNSVNMGDKCMHLTNYSINKHSEKYDKDEGKDTVGTGGSKRSLKWFLKWLREKEGSTTVDKLWDEISEICVKTVLSILPVLVSEYNTTFKLSQGFKVDSDEPDDENERDSPKEYKEKSNMENDLFPEKLLNLDIKDLPKNLISTDDCGRNSQYERNKHISDDNGREMEILGSRCSQILGIDILIDENLKPFLLEVNALPSYGTSAKIDHDVKSRLISQALATFQSHPDDKQKYEIEKKKKSKIRLTNQSKNKENNVGKIPCTENTGNQQSSDSLITKMGPGYQKSNETSIKYESSLAKVEGVKEKIYEIYKTHAPQNLDKIGALFIKYSGNEDYLLSQIEAKYCKKTFDSFSMKKRDEDINTFTTSAGSNYNRKTDTHTISNYSFDQEDDSSLEAVDSDNETEDICLHRQVDQLHSEERHLPDYDRIYPNFKHKSISSSQPDYDKMKSYAFEEFLRKLDRLICPLYMKRLAACLGEDNQTNKHAQYESRGDSWINGDMFLRKCRLSSPKQLAEPSPHQLEVAQRLSSGLCANNFESEMPWNIENMNQRVVQAMEDARNMRKKMEIKLARKHSEPIPIKQIDLFGMDVAFIPTLNSNLPLKDELKKKKKSW